MAAKEKELGDLHISVTKRLAHEVASTESDPRFVGMAIKFLADNKVTMIKEISNELGELDKNLQRRKKRFGKENITDIATRMAKQEATG